jgi:hypothetical protein
MKRNRTQVFLGLALVLTLVSLGCGLTERLGTRLAGDPVKTVSVITRTPWPTFTPTPGGVAAVSSDETGGQAVVMLNNLPTSTPTMPPADTPTPLPPTDTPTPVPPTPTDTPLPPPTKPPAPPPAPTATPVPAPPPKPQYQFSPAPWYAGEPNAAIVRFYGHIKDASGGAVNGYSVKATCGDYFALSFPSGPSPFAPDWAPGWYDIVANPISCSWTLQVVEYQCNTAGFDAKCKEYETLSEAVPVVTDVGAGETIIVADWIKNW